MPTATISKASGVVDCNYLNLVDSAATGGAAFYAGVNSTDGGGNTGWSFTADPATIATITKASGLVESEYTSITHSAATGGAKFYAPNSTDGGNNTGWIFALPPHGGPSVGRTGVVYHLNRLAGTDALEMAGAANAWAGTDGLEVVGALNARLAQVDSTHSGRGLEMNGVCKRLAAALGGEPDREAAASLASIPT